MTAQTHSSILSLVLSRAFVCVDDWPALYDIARLRTNTVPVVAAIYYDDMYVDHNLSIDTLRAIACTKKWVTDEYEHSGIRTDGERVLGRLLDILHGDLY